MPSPILFVGESNPYGSDPDYALFCEPPESAGGRLCRLVCGLRRPTYLALARVNLCQNGDWGKTEARSQACLILQDDETPKVVVMLGRKVQEAFGYGFKDRPDDELFTWYKNGDLTMVIMPHPSGLNRRWNELGAFLRARELLREVCPSVPWGEIDG